MEPSPYQKELEAKVQKNNNRIKTLEESILLHQKDIEDSKAIIQLALTLKDQWKRIDELELEENALANLSQSLLERRDKLRALPNPS